MALSAIPSQNEVAQYGVCRQVLHSYVKISKTKPTEALYSFFVKDEKVKGTLQELPEKNRQHTIFGIRAFHNVQFAGANTVEKQQKCLAFERSTIFELKFVDKGIVSVPLEQLLTYHNQENIDGSVTRIPKDYAERGIIYADQNQPVIQDKTLNDSKIDFLLSTAQVLPDPAGITTKISPFVEDDEYYVLLELDVESVSTV